MVNFNKVLTFRYVIKAIVQSVSPEFISKQELVCLHWVHREREHVPDISSIIQNRRIAELIYFMLMQSNDE